MMISTTLLKGLPRRSTINNDHIIYKGFYDEKTTERYFISDHIFV